MIEHLLEVIGRQDVHAVHHRALGFIRLGQHDLFEALAFGRQHHRQHTPDWPQIAIKGQLAEKQRVRKIPFQLIGGREQPDSDGQIVRRPFFFKIGRCQIDSHFLVRIGVSVVFNRRKHPISGFLDTRIRQTDDNETRQTVI